MKTVLGSNNVLGQLGKSLDKWRDFWQFLQVKKMTYSMLNMFLLLLPFIFVNDKIRDIYGK